MTRNGKPMPDSNAGYAGSADFAYVVDPSLNGRIDDLVVRVDGLADLLEGIDRRQGMLEPIVTKAVAPVLDHVEKLSDAHADGMLRLSGQFSQLSDTMSNVPQAVARETRAHPPLPPLDLSGLHRRFDDLREGLDDLAATLDHAAPAGAGLQDGQAAAPMASVSSGAIALMPPEPRFAADPTHFIGAEMDALHSRFDQLTVRIEQLADVVEGGTAPIGRLPSVEIVPVQGTALEVVSRDVLQRLDDLRAMLAKVGMAELPPVVQRLETSNRTLVNVISEWRSAGSPVTREVLDGAVAGLNRQLRDLGGTECIMAAINELRAILQHGLEAPAAVVTNRFDPAEPMAAFRVELEATVAPIRRLTSVAEAAVLRLQAKAEEAGSDRALPMVRDMASDDAALSDVRIRLDGIQARIDTFAARAEAGHEALRHLASLTESFNEETLVARLDQSNQAIAETLLGFESRMEQPLADLRDSIVAARGLVGHAAEPILVATAAVDETEGDEQPFGPTSLVAALNAMSGFMAAIEARYDAVESLAGGVGAPDASDPATLDVFSQGIVEMRRLTDEFLDISCAITGELAEHAKPQYARTA